MLLSKTRRYLDWLCKNTINVFVFLQNKRRWWSFFRCWESSAAPCRTSPSSWWRRSCSTRPSGASPSPCAPPWPRSEAFWRPSSPLWSVVRRAVDFERQRLIEFLFRLSSQGKANPAIPYLVLGIVNIVVGLLSLLLPETKGLPMPSNIAEAKAQEKWVRRCKSISPTRYYWFHNMTMSGWILPQANAFTARLQKEDCGKLISPTHQFFWRIAFRVVFFANTKRILDFSKSKLSFAFILWKDTVLKRYHWN